MRVHRPRPAQRLPYGVWTCADGREVLFDRRYAPLLQRRGRGPAATADPGERVAWVTQAWFYTDENPPVRTARDGRVVAANKDTLLRLARVVVAFGTGADVARYVQTRWSQAA